MDYGTGDNPTAASWADLNGDGKRDLAVSNRNSDTVSVLMNNGNGTFSPRVDYAVGDGPVTVASGDFDGDGMADLAVGNGDSSTVSVLLNNGYGTLIGRADYNVGGGCQSVTSGDFNGDGKADLAVVNSESDAVSVLLSKSSFSLAPRVDYAAGHSPHAVTWGELNGDGKADLAVANYGDGTVSVLMNSGNGTFAAKVDYVVSGYPYSMISADFDGDGKRDLAVGCWSSPRVHVLMNNGNGTFGAKVGYDVISDPVSITAADLNGDGKADLATADGLGGTASVLLNNGNGTFAARVGYQATARPESITSADFDGDGKADLAVAGEGGVSVVLNRSTTVTLNQAAWQVEPTGAAVIHFTAVFSNAVTGFSGNDVILEGTAGATTATVTGSGSTYDVAVSGMTRGGTVIVSIGEYAAEDGAGFWTSASTSMDNCVVFTKLISLTTPPVSGASVWRNQAYRIQWSGGVVGVSVQIWRRDGKGAVKLADAVPAELGYYDWDTSGVADGWYCFGAWVNPGDGGQWVYEASPGWVHVVNRGPVIALTTPAVPTEINQGPTYSINWQASDPDGDPLHVALWAYSSDTGWFAIPGAEWLDASLGTFAWSTSNAKPGWYCFAGNVWDGSVTVSGKSPNWLHVNGPKPTFAFVTPKNGQTSKFGSAFSIQWQATVPQGQNQTKVELWYCYLDWKDGNKPVWQRIAGNLDPVAAKYSWKTSNLNPDYRWYSFAAWIGYGNVWVNVASEHWLRLV